MKPSLQIVGIGASAGGLEAFTQLLKQLDVNTGMAFILVQHLAPGHPSSLSELLSRATKMPVSEVENGTAVEPNHVYVLPPNTKMEIENGTLKLTPRGTEPASDYRPIDDFFQSLANDQQLNAIGVILSGTGSDGARGLDDIRAQGGVTFSQNVESAKFSGMPSAAIERGVDYILPPGDIAIELLKHARSTQTSSDVNNSGGLLNKEVDPKGIRKILDLLKLHQRVNFLNYKYPTVQRRIQRRISLNKLSSTTEYLSFLKSNPGEIKLLYEDILVKVTSFFRNAETFEALAKNVFPAIFANVSAEASVRVWVAGCATGEEAYSIAIRLLEYIDENKIVQKIEIFATDISEIALTKARLGCFDESIAVDVSPQRLSRFFTKENQTYRITSRVRECCVFAKQDLTIDPPFSRIDLITCRNLLIYLTPPVQKRILAAFHFGLKPNGFLALGNAESIGSATDIYGVTDSLNKIYYKMSGMHGVVVPDFVSETLRKNSGYSLPGNQPLAEVTSKADLRSCADQAILSRIEPPGVIINEQLEIVEVRGDTTPFLMIPPGNLTTNLSRMCRPGLLVDLRHSIYEAGERKETVQKNGWISGDGQSARPVVIEVIPFLGPASKENFFAVLFTESESTRGDSLPTIDLVNATSRLEKELSETKKYLNAIIEKEQASNEEIKSASEEILSSNQELQSTNEEMATAKEEIQATNEELSTVNNELQNRNIELKRLNNDLTNLFASVQIPIIMLTENLIVRRFTQSAEKVFNLSTSDIGKSLADVSSDFKLTDLPKLVSDVMESLNTLDLEIQNHNGKWYSLRIKPYRTLDNKIDGAVIALVDIDGLKRSIDELKLAYDYADSIVQTAPTPLVVLDSSLKIVTANKAFCNHFKIIEKELTRKKIYDVADGKWNLPKLRLLLEDILPKNQVMDNFIIDHEFDNLGRRTLRLSARRLVQKSDEDAKILIAFQDLTAEKRTEEEMSVAMEASESASQAKSDFVANISHEIRTPLGVILGYSEIIAEAGQDLPEVKNAVSRIRSNVEQLTELIGEILDISKIEAGMFENDCHRFALIPELAETFALLKNRAEGKSLELSIEFKGGIPEYVYACSKGLRQILFNIVGNALKFTEKGSVQVFISVVPPIQGQLSSKLSIVVKDTGCGVSKEQQSHLFKPFSQADSSVTRRYGGTGLGLLLARRLAEVHGGTVELTESVVGKGSTFTITVDIGPLQDEKILAGVTESSMNLNEKVYSDWFSANKRLNGVQILLVEDGLDNQALMNHFLLASGADVELAVNGAEAVEKACASFFDVVLMDIQMPILDGYQATRQLRKRGYTGAILALTAHAMQGEREKCLAAGFNDYLSKPVKPNFMIKVIAGLAKKKDINKSEVPYRSLHATDPVVGPLVEGFIRNTQKHVREIQVAHQKKNWHEIGVIAHQLLGAAEGYGFPEMGKIAATIESLAKTKENSLELSEAIVELSSLSAKADRGLKK